MIGYKLFKVRKDGTLGTLFFDCRMRLPINEWMEAKMNLTKKGFATRPGWHITHAPEAPHLSMKNRRWYTVEFKDFTEHQRPEAQGGLWYTARWMRIIEPTFS